MARGETTLARNRVRELRMKSLMTQTELAKRAQIKQGVLSRIEKGDVNPSLDSAIRIALALGVGLDDLFLPSVETKIVPDKVTA